MSPAREPLPTRVEDTLVLPPGYDDALDAGLAALGVTLDAPGRAVIAGHVRLLLAWSGSINLTSIRDPRYAAVAHVLDSLSALEAARQLAATRLLDLGSGGGFPGIPLAVALGGEGTLLVEATRKKARFLETVVGATGLAGRVMVAADRAEDVARDPRHRGQWPLVTARAVAGLAELVELAFPLLANGGSLFAWKRGDIDRECEAAERAIHAVGGGGIRVIDVAVDGLEGHRIVVATRTGTVPDLYPRDPAVRRRRPW